MWGLALAQRTAPKSKGSGADRDRLGAKAKAAYEGGASVRQIAAELGRSYGATHQLLTEAGVDFRPRGGRHGRPRRRD
jgi:transposase